MKNELCECNLCKHIEQIKATGVPEKVVVHFINVLDDEFLNLSIASLIGLSFVEKVEVHEGVYIERLDKLVNAWREMRESAGRMVDDGVLSDDVFMDAIVHPDPIKTANLAQRIKDYAARETR